MHEDKFVILKFYRPNRQKANRVDITFIEKNSI